MSASFSLNPKKLKVQLTSLREAISSLETTISNGTTTRTTTTNDGVHQSKQSNQSNQSNQPNQPKQSKQSKAFLLLLICELASRRVGLPLPPQFSQWTFSTAEYLEFILSVLDAIRSTAGKVAIDAIDAGGSVYSGEYPMPMMAALNAALGMAASACSACSACYACVDEGNSGNCVDGGLLPMQHDAIRTACETTLHRCQEVNDGRFFTLLGLANVANEANVANVSSESSGTRATHATHGTHATHHFHHFNNIAYGNYIYGASYFAVDQPPMWKRCLDSALVDAVNSGNSESESSGNSGSHVGSGNNTNSGNSVTSESTTNSANSGSNVRTSEINHQAYQNQKVILPIQNMIRIALSKGNDKRASELGVGLVLGCLGSAQEKLEKLKGWKSDASTTSTTSTTSNSSSASTTSTASSASCDLAQQTMEQLIESHFLNRTHTVRELKRASIEHVLEIATEALKRCPPPPKSLDQRKNELGELGESSKESNLSELSGASGETVETWLVYRYAEVQITYFEEESRIANEVQQQYRAVLNRMPDSSSSSSSSSYKAGGIGSGSGATSKSTSTSKSQSSSSSAKAASSAKAGTTPTATTKRELETQIRSNIHLEAWDSWRSQSLQSSPSSSSSQSSSTPSTPPDWNALSLLALRDLVMALPSLTPSASPTKDGDTPHSSSSPDIPWYATLDLVHDCYRALSHQVERLVEMAVNVQQRQQRQLRQQRILKKGTNTTNTTKTANTPKPANTTNTTKAEEASMAWNAVLEFTSPLVEKFLFPLVAGGERRESGESGSGCEVPLENPEHHTLRQLMECGCEAIVAALWMLEPLEPSSLDSLGSLGSLGSIPEIPLLLSQTHRCLTVCRKGRSLQEKHLMERRKEEESRELGRVGEFGAGGVSGVSGGSGKGGVSGIGGKGGKATAMSAVSAMSSVKYSESEKMELSRLECALATSKCRMDLEGVLGSRENGGNGNASTVEISTDSLTAVARNATIAAIHSNKANSVNNVTNANKSNVDSKSSHQAMFGSPFLQCLSAWSGMYLAPFAFCTIGQARSIVKSARECLVLSGKVWGRSAGGAGSTGSTASNSGSTGSPSCRLEQLVLDLGEADAESTLAGGLVKDAEQLYQQTLNTLRDLRDLKHVMDDSISDMLQVHCLLGLGKLALSQGSRGSSEAGTFDGVVPRDPSSDSAAAAEDYGRKALDILLSYNAHNHPTDPIHPTLLCIYPWSIPSLHQLSHSYHLCASRQLVAEACLRSSRPEDAHSFLSQAVRDSPGNFDAALALAAFHLRSLLEGPSAASAASAASTASAADGDAKTKETLARTMLLKAAKVNTSKPDPFALLGIYYEKQTDVTRAKGCYQKALKLDPSHPVAGRGLQRLLPLDDFAPFCDGAVTQNSPVIGWAWRAIGQQRWREGDDTNAVVCFQQALRCRDVQSGGTEAWGTFYLDPTKRVARGNSEAGDTWSELASCYRRLGKFSAALRAYDAANAVSLGCLAPSVVCAWAQVELDLGLFDEAAAKCDEILSNDGASHVQRMASHIEGKALLSLAKRDEGEGKFGSALSHLKKGIDRLTKLSLQDHPSFAEVKLRGDLYSLADSLPPYVFISNEPSSEEKSTDASDHLPQNVKNQLCFIAKGEEAYKSALEIAEADEENEEDKSFLVASAATDLGTNLLCQAKVRLLAMGEGSGGQTKSSVADLAEQSNQIGDLLKRSVEAYLKAVDASPHDASAWCGLGCVLLAFDPLLSQHAFVRSLQIDRSLADSWSNVGLLYGDFEMSEKSSEVLDALTQVADTPLMWIGRGILLEKRSSLWEGQISSRESCLAKAADAYRASLQIMQHPAALLGLSLTCRRTGHDNQTLNDAVYSSLLNQASKFESKTSMAIHQNSTGGYNIGATYVDGLMRVEEGLECRNSFRDAMSRDLIAQGRELLQGATSSFEKCQEDCLVTGTGKTKCVIDFPTSSEIKPKVTGDFPLHDIDKAMKEASIVENDTSDAPPNSKLGVTDARNAVYMNPESGEAWLQLAKAIVQELSTDMPASDKDYVVRDVLASAKRAASKAVELLRDRVFHATLITPRSQRGNTQKSVVSRIPSAPLVSEAMSILAWLEDAEATQLGKDLPSSSYINHQESFLLDPSNNISLEALDLTNRNE